MPEPIEELALLREESERVRVARPGVRIQWPEDFRKRAGTLVVRGLSSREVAREPGVNNGTVVEWRRRQVGEGGFAELKVVAPRRMQTSVTVATKQGHTLTLSPALARQWLQEGVL